MPLPNPKEKSLQMKGNQNAKKDFTKEIAKNMVAKEFFFLAKVLADIPTDEVNKFLKENNFKLSILGSKTIEQITKGNWKALQWFWEMSLGKPKQMSELIGINDGIKAIEELIKMAKGKTK